MACPYHCRQGPFSAGPVGSEIGIRPDTPSPGVPQCSGGGLLGRELMRRYPILLVDSSGPERLADPRRAVAALRQGSRLRKCVESVVDDPARSEPFHEALYLRGGIAFPAAFAQLSIEIGRELRTSGCELPHVEKCKLVQSLSVERLAWAGSPLAGHWPKLCHTRTPSQPGLQPSGHFCRAFWAVSCDQGEGLLDRNNTIVADLAPAGATPTLDAQPRRVADFATLGEALDYAGQGRRGMNFHDARGQLVRAYPFAELREDALAHVQRFIAMGLNPGDRFAMIAETGAE